MVNVGIGDVEDLRAVFSVEEGGARPLSELSSPIGVVLPLVGFGLLELMRLDKPVLRASDGAGVDELEEMAGPASAMCGSTDTGWSDETIGLGEEDRALTCDVEVVAVVLVVVVVAS